MPGLSATDLIWNRACLGDDANSRPGDRALAALLAFHSVAMSGGVLYALQILGAEKLKQAESGYRYFCLESVANLLHDNGGILNVGDELDLWESELDSVYGALIPDDSTLVARFEMVFRQIPWEFAPI